MAEKYVIVSGKGGVGKSTIAMLLGKSLARAGKRVLLIDADISLGSLELLFPEKSENIFHWGDVMTGRVDKMSALRMDKNFMLLTAPPTFRPYGQPERFAELVHSYNDVADIILIDAPAGIGDGMKLAAAPAEKALVIGVPDEVSVHGALKAGYTVTHFKESGPKQARLIINRFCRKAVRKFRQFNIDKVIDSTGVRLIGIIPEDKNLWYFGTGGFLLKKNSPALEASDRIAYRLLGQNIPLDLEELK